MLQASPAFVTRTRPLVLARWLWIVAALIVAMVVVGGITRLTESGLSITQWRPLDGAVPPLTDAGWRTEFSRYQATEQFRLLNRGMTLDGFRQIFFWEWVHRELGRFIGLAVAAPLAWFAWRRRLPPGYTPRLLALLTLVGLQGTLGWLMVRAGLWDHVKVPAPWLAAHLLTALFTLAGFAWTALDLVALARRPYGAPARVRPVAVVALVLLFAQLGLGALTAGLDAGYAFNSWPLMGDRLFPAGAVPAGAGVATLWTNPIVVQFIHRWLAFGAAAGLLTLAWRAMQAGSRAGLVVAALVVLQIGLGIATLMMGVQIEIAVWHQANAALLVLAAVTAAHAAGQAVKDRR